MCSQSANSGTDSWAVIGGGMLGLAAAWKLRQAGHDVTLMEARPQLGGLADAWQLGDICWDRHYHVTLLSDLKLRALLKELQLDDEMQWVETRTGFYTDRQLYSMSNTLEFLQFPPLRLIDKLRLGGTIFYASKIRNWQKLEQIPVGDWLARLSGSRTFEKIWRPLLRAKLGDCWKDTSAAFIWATIARMYAARRSGLKKEMFGYLPGGYGRLLSVLKQQLVDAGVQIHCNCPTDSVTWQDGRVAVQAGGGTHSFDRAVLTVPSPVVPALLPQLDGQQADLHRGIRYHGIVCASVLLKQPLSPYYVTNITDDNVPFTAVIEMSALVDRQQFGGHSLIYLPKYVTPDDETFERSDAELEAEFLQALERMYPQFAVGDVLEFRVSRVKHVFALPTLGYSRRLPPVQTSVPGVFALNSSQIVNGTLNVNESVGLAADFVAGAAMTAKWASERPVVLPAGV